MLVYQTWDGRDDQPRDQLISSSGIACQAAGPSHSWSLGEEILRFDHDQSAIGDGQVPIGAAPRAGNHGKNHRFKKAVKMCEGLRNCAVLHCSWSLFFLDSHCMIFGNPNSPAFWDGSGYITRYPKTASTAWGKLGNQATPRLHVSRHLTQWVQPLGPRIWGKLLKSPKKGETSATKLGLWNFFSRLWAERWSVSCNITSHWSVGLFRSCWESHKINLVNWGPQKSKKVNTFF